MIVKGPREKSQVSHDVLRWLETLIAVCREALYLLYLLYKYWKASYLMLSILFLDNFVFLSIFEMISYHILWWIITFSDDDWVKILKTDSPIRFHIRLIHQMIKKAIFCIFLYFFLIFVTSFGKENHVFDTRLTISTRYI